MEICTKDGQDSETKPGRVWLNEGNDATRESCYPDFEHSRAKNEAGQWQCIVWPSFPGNIARW